MISNNIKWSYIVGILFLLCSTSHVVTSIFNTMPPSKIWNFFTRGESNTTAICSICHDVLKNMGSTTILWSHYNRWHKPTNEINEDRAG